MNELIKISDYQGRKIVNARHLHVFLESKQDFSNWIKNRIDKYYFLQNQDYVCIYLDIKDNKIIDPNQQLVRGQYKIEYGLTVPMAKELSMVEDNEKGKQARQYFIECEKQLNQYQLPKTFADALQLAANQAKQIELQDSQIKELSPKAEVYDNISDSTGLKTIKEVAKILGTGEHRLFKWLKDEKILMKSNLPFQKYITQGYFEVKSKLIPGLSQNYSQTFITSRGELWLAKVYKNCHNPYLLLN